MNIFSPILKSAFVFVLVSGCASPTLVDEATSSNTQKQPRVSVTPNETQADAKEADKNKQDETDKKTKDNRPALVEHLKPSPLKGRDGLVSYTGWLKAPWGNDLNITATTWGEATENHLLVLELKNGASEKCALSLPVKLSFEGVKIIALDVFNTSNKSMDVAFAVFSTPDRVFAESVRHPVMPGWNRVLFDVDAKTFKAKSTNWQHKQALYGRKDIREVVLLFYSPIATSVIVDGLFDTGKKK